MMSARAVASEYPSPRSASIMAEARGGAKREPGGKWVEEEIVIING